MTDFSSRRGFLGPALGAGAALFVAGRTRSVLEGWELAEQIIDTGRAAAKLEELQVK